MRDMIWCKYYYFNVLHRKYCVWQTEVVVSRGVFRILSKTKLFPKLDNGQKPLTSFAESSILDIWGSFEYASWFFLFFLWKTTGKIHYSIQFRFISKNVSLSPTAATNSIKIIKMSKCRMLRWIATGSKERHKTVKGPPRLKLLEITI